MAKYEITKSIDVDEINKRSGMPTGKKRTIPFGAIIQDRVEDRDLERFTYLGELYRTKSEELNAAVRLIGDASAAASAPASATGSSPVARSEYKLKWETIHSSIPASRCKVPGGWLVSITNNGLTFMPDAEHDWDGSSV